VNWLTLLELDRRLGRPKGTAFRAFKQRAPRWREGEDFRVLQPRADAPEIAALRAAGRVYASSRTVILLSGAAARRIVEDSGRE
jgi:hypothetical protein